MAEDLRCCGTGTCLINAEGVCWCGQRWDGTKMCFADKQPHGIQAALQVKAPGENSSAGVMSTGPLPDPSPSTRGS